MHQGGMMVHSEGELRSEDQARPLNKQVSEQHPRVLFPEQQTSSEIEQQIHQLRKLNRQKRNEDRPVLLEQNHY